MDFFYCKISLFLPKNLDKMVKIWYYVELAIVAICYFLLTPSQKEIIMGNTNSEKNYVTFKYLIAVIFFVVTMLSVLNFIISFNLAQEEPPEGEFVGAFCQTEGDHVVCTLVQSFEDFNKDKNNATRKASKRWYEKQPGYKKNCSTKNIESFIRHDYRTGVPLDVCVGKIKKKSMVDIYRYERIKKLNFRVRGEIK
jgi:hypothetical protein